MNKVIGWLLGAVVVVGLIVGFYMMQDEPVPEVLPTPPAIVPLVIPQEPVEMKPVQQSTLPPLPTLKDSDPAMIDALATLLGKDAFQKHFRLEMIVRHIVTTIDNLPNKSAAARLFPTKPVSGQFITQGDEENRSISTNNFSRYAHYVSIAEAVDAKKLVAVYMRFAPLFQRAYQNLGYPKGIFNERLITVIDHLLGAPDLKGRIALTQPNVMFQYADPDMEAQSAGRKILMRMGSQNAQKVKAKLKLIRTELKAQFAKQLSAK